MTDLDVQGNPLATTDEERCTIALGEAGDDSRRCTRLAWPLHRTHLIEGMYHMPKNTDELNAELRLAHPSKGTK